MWVAIGIGLGVIVVLAIGVVGIGAALPQEHLASRAATLRQPIDAVWRTIEDVAAIPTWRTGVARVEIRDAEPERRAWSEHARHGAIPLRVIVREPPRRLVVRIDSDTLPFGGTWTYELESIEQRSTRLRITERGVVKPPAFRFLGRYVFGTERTIVGYLSDIARRFGEAATIERRAAAATTER